VFLFAKKNLKKLLLVSVCFIIYVACSQSPFFDIANRSENPLNNETSKKCVVSSFELENAIVIRWDRNDKAKKYILYRDEIANDNFSKIVYEGEELSFIDKNVDIGKLYYYKLAVKFDDWVSGKSDYSYGVAGLVKDSFEDNDSKEVSKTILSDLTVDIKANAFCFKDNFNNILKDDDWYKINISKREKQEFIIDCSTDLELLFQQEGRSVYSVTSGSSLWLYNDGTANEDIRFRVYPDENKVSKKQIVYKLKKGSIKQIQAEEPTIKMFESEKNIKITWKSYSLAKKYILYRDVLNNGPFTEKIYDGANLYYDDNSVDVAKFYYYKLAVVFNDCTSDKSEPAFGIAGLKKDDYELNDTESTSNVLDISNEITANICYFKSRYNNIVDDLDWYKVNVPAGKMQEILVSYLPYNLDESTKALGFNNKELYLQQKDKAKYLIETGESLWLYNNTNNSENIDFQIFVDNDKFNTEEIKKQGRYQIKFGTLKEIVSKQPTVTSFELDNKIKIEWSIPNKEVTEYILYRSSSIEKDAAEDIVYRGKDTNTIDNTVDVEKFYYYKVAIQFANSQYTSEKSEPSYGVAGLKKDANESTDSEANPRVIADLTGSVTANVYYFDDILKDQEDWYSINIPANSMRQVVVDCTRDDYTVGQLLIQQQGKDTISVTSGKKELLYNNSNTDAAIKFKVLINTSKVSKKQLKYKLSFGAENKIVSTKPRVTSYEDDNRIKIEWDKIPRDLKYLLYRYDSLEQMDSVITPYKEFAASDFIDKTVGSFLDTDVIVDKIYYYKVEIILDDSTSSGQSDYFYGVAGYKKDIYEANDDLTADILNINKNKILTDSISASIYSVKRNQNSLLLLNDIDWYCVNIKPNSVRSIRIDNISNIFDEELLFCQKNGGERKIYIGKEFFLYNNTDVTADIYFKTYFDNNKVLTKSGKYKLSLGTEKKLTSSIPRVKSFEEENKIKIEWDTNDFGKYVLYRGALSYKGTDLTIDFTKIHEGEDLFFYDSPLPNKFYYYKVAALVDNNVIMGYSLPARGVAGAKNDTFEINNQKLDQNVSQITSLNAIEASFHYVRGDSYNTTPLMDTDWYYVIVSPNSMREIVLEKSSNDLSNDDLIFAQEDGTPVSIKFNNNVCSNTCWLYNNTLDSKAVYFKIFPDESKIANKSCRYKISLGIKKDFGIKDITVRSFELNNQIKIEWASHDLAQKYIIYRSTNKSVGFTNIKEITDKNILTYIDNENGNSLNKNTFYYYQVETVIDSSTSNLSQVSYGVAGFIKDKQANDTENNAKLLTLTDKYDDYIHYFKDNENIFQDEDWYTVELDGNSMQEIVVDCTNDYNAGELLLQQKDKELIPITSGKKELLYNNDSSKSFIKFRILVDTTKVTKKQLKYMVSFGGKQQLISTEPTVTSFAEDNKIEIKWSKHILASKYVLYKYESPTGNYTNKIEITDTDVNTVYTDQHVIYTDTNVIKDKLYFYKVEIILNDNTSAGISTSSYGIGAYKKDLYEPNDDKANAKKLPILNSNEIEGSIYYFRDLYNFKVEDYLFQDVDWYYVTLPPNTIREIGIQNVANINDGDLFYLQEDGKEKLVTTGDKFWLYNNKDVTSDIYFKIYPNTTKTLDKSGKYRLNLGTEKKMMFPSPIVKSFEEDDVIKIEWAANDFGKYVLYRSLSSNDGFTEIWRGDKLNFDDKPSKDTFYYYKIKALIDDTIIIGDSDYGRGVAGYKKDIYELNDQKLDAKVSQVTNAIEASIYFIDDSYKDTDWYYIVVSPNSMREIKIEQVTTNILSGDLMFAQENGDSVSISFGNTTCLAYNNSSVTKQIYFRVFPDSTKMINKSGKYRINLGIERDFNIQRPIVKSFELYNQVKIEWTPHSLAQKYILYRSTQQTQDFVKIAEITDKNILTYSDSPTPSMFYYYKVEAVIDNLTSTLSEPSFGISGNIKDINGNNDTKENAKLMSIIAPNNEKDDNIHYFNDNSGNITEDYDWYSVSIPANSMQEIKVDFIDNLTNSDLLLYQEGKSVVPITSSSIWLYNDTSVFDEKIINFRLSVDHSKNKQGRYKVRLIGTPKEILAKKPIVTSFIDDDKIKIEWYTHSLGRKYIIYRDLSPVGSFTDERYRFDTTNDEIKILNFTDTCEKGKMYYYKVQIEFTDGSLEKSDMAYGGVGFKEDSYENNNYKALAKYLNNPIDGNVYYFKDSYNNILQDEDWYYMTVLSNNIQEVKIKILDINFENEDIMLYQEGKENIPIIKDLSSDSVSLWLYNTDNSNQVYFKILTTNKKVLNKQLKYNLSLGLAKDIDSKKPNVISFLTENTIIVEWQKYYNTTQTNNNLLYRLYRSEYSTTGFSLIKEIKDSEVTNSTITYQDNVTIGKIFYYKVELVFDSNKTSMSEAGYGVAGFQKDGYEANDDKDNAKTLETKDAAIYYFYDNGNTLEDKDWYKVNIPANSMQELIIEYTKNFVNGDLLFNQEGRTASSIIHGGSFWLYNKNTIASDINFNINVDTSKVLNKQGQYRITKGATKIITPSKPDVRSFSNQISIEWQAHPLAQKYILYRYTYPYNSNNGQKIYEGTNLNYPDTTGLIAGNLYYYNVSISIDNWESNKSEIKSGVAGLNPDSYNDKNSAKFISGAVTENIYYFDDGFGSIIKDDDWFYINVSANTSSVVRIDGFTDITNDELLFNKENETTISVNATNKDFLFTNASSSSTGFYFRVSTSSSFMNKMGNYNITVTPNVDQNVRYPETVSAIIVDHRINISWSNVVEASSYQVFRKTATSDYVIINTSDVIGTTYTDTTFELDKNITYKIRSKRNGIYSSFSPESNIVVENSTAIIVDNTNLKASVFEINGKIRVSWNVVTGADSYKIYRYLSKVDNLPSNFATNSNFYEDTTVTPDTPYFYKVSVIKDGKEYTKSDFVFGACGNSVDLYEPSNNDISNLASDATTVFSPLDPPLAYCFLDGDNGVVKDIDWYKYSGANSAFRVIVTLPDNSTFDNGDLMFKYRYNGKDISITSLNKGKNIINFPTTEYLPGATTVDVYFQIYLKDNLYKNAVTSYTVSIE